MEGGWGAGVFFGGEDVPVDICKQWKKKYNPEHYNDNRVDSLNCPFQTQLPTIETLILGGFLCHDLLLP